MKKYTAYISWSMGVLVISSAEFNEDGTTTELSEGTVSRLYELGKYSAYCDSKWEALRRLESNLEFSKEQLESELEKLRSALGKVSIELYAAKVEEESNV